MKIVSRTLCFLFVAIVFTAGSTTMSAAAEKKHEKIDFELLLRNVYQDLSLYIDIQKELAADSLDNVADNAQSLYDNLITTAGIANALGTKKIEAKMLRMAKNAKLLTDDKLELDDVRTVFRDLSEQASDMAVNVMPSYGRENVYVYYDKENDAYWVQLGKGVRNPYTGDSSTENIQFIHFDDFDAHLRTRNKHK